MRASSSRPPRMKALCYIRVTAASRLTRSLVPRTPGSIQANGPSARTGHFDSARCSLFGCELAELAAPRRMPQLSKRVGLDLADPLARQAELVPNLLERPRSAVVEPEPKPDHALLPALEGTENLCDLLLEHLVLDHLVR